jgi:hypothetical protein
MQSPFMAVGRGALRSREHPPIVSDVSPRPATPDDRRRDHRPDTTIAQLLGRTDPTC